MRQFWLGVIVGIFAMAAVWGLWAILMQVM